MKVKIGNTVYDSSSEPIMIILSPEDKKNISSMQDSATKYASFPDGWTDPAQMRAWMKTDQNNVLESILNVSTSDKTGYTKQK